MKATNGRNMFVFRDGRRSYAGALLLARLAELVRSLPTPEQAGNQWIEALLRAGELECALWDAGSAAATEIAALTDALASALVESPTPPVRVSHLTSLLPHQVPPELKVSPAEGFAYYALHPLDYQKLAERMVCTSRQVAVIGIRSIGITLSAIVAAALRRRGVEAERTSVRPVGHPYDRRTGFSPEQLPWLMRHRAAGAELLVVDEGPGMSGSSFLSSGDALVAAGIPRERITFLCSRQPDIGSLHAPNAVERWPSFRAYYKSPTDFLPADARIYLGGGAWRHYMFSSEQEWPASWVSMERLKFLSPDLKTWFKFEGLGRFGRAAYERALACAEAGFSVPPGEFLHGFISYPMVQGHCLTTATSQPRGPHIRPLLAKVGTEHRARRGPGGPAVERKLLDRLARYCAFRFRAFTVPPDDEWRQLETMLRFNVAEEFGVELDLPEAALRSAQPIIADARMLPHKWLRSRAGELVKVGAASHGDDHFFPGPTDIAWDLAGVMFEWELNRDAVHYLISRYSALTGDHPELRLPHFLLAYSVFRMSYCKMAAEAMRGSGAEEHRLAQAYRRYREYAATLLKARLPIGALANESITEPLAEAV